MTGQWRRQGTLVGLKPPSPETPDAWSGAMMQLCNKKCQQKVKQICYHQMRFFSSSKCTKTHFRHYPIASRGKKFTITIIERVA